jgi:hypothetical protein
LPDDDKPELEVDDPHGSDAEFEASESTRGTVELPAVVLSEERQRMAPRRRLLPGLIDRKLLLYPSYLLTVVAGGIAVHVAIDSTEWHPLPVIIGWAMLYLWEWIYSAAYGYRRTVLKYFSAIMVTLMAGLLTIVSLDKAAAQTVVSAGKLVDRDPLGWLKWTAYLTVAASLPIILHLLLLGRGYREKKET